MNEQSWNDEDKRRWLEAQGGAPTHVITFEPIFQVEVCVPPWEHAERDIARKAVNWGRRMQGAFDEVPTNDVTVLAAHHEGNALEVHAAVTPRARLHRLR